MPTRYLIGLLLLLLGIGLLVEALYLPGSHLVARWWPVLLVIWGVNAIVRAPRRPFWPFILLLVGILLLARYNGLLNVNAWYIVGAAALILIGLRMLLPGRIARREVPGGETIMVHPGNQLNQSVAFSTTTIQVRSREFRGGRVSVSFGGAVVDLREANLAPEGAHLRLDVTFGSITVRVPVGWPVVVEGAPALGGTDVRLQNTEIAAPNGAVLRIGCSGAFGGIEIEN